MKNLIFAFRILRRNPMMFVVNLIGLGFALTSVILTLSYIRYELSYDKHFATKDRVVRLYNKVTNNTSSEVYGIALREAYTQLPSRVPEVDAAMQLYGVWSSSVGNKNITIDKARRIYADKEFFKVFGLSLLHGDTKAALTSKMSVVITTEIAKKLFNTSECLGKTIESEGEVFTISGVMDKLPKNTHFDFDYIVSFASLPEMYMGGLEYQTYYLLKPHVDKKIAGEKIASINNSLMKNWAASTNSKVQSGVEPLTDLYLSSIAADYIPNHGSLRQLVIVSLITLFVLLTALISYINLFIIHGQKRIAEISTRFMFGAAKSSIAKIFFTETLVIFLCAVVLAIIISYVALPAFSVLILSKVGVAEMFSSWGIATIGFVLVVLLAIASAYPMVYLFRMKYALGLRGKLSNTGRNHRFSAATVLMQFTVTAFFISCVVIVFSQISYMRNVPKGFNVENVNTFTGFSEQITTKYESVKSELLKLPFVESVSGGEHFMGGGCSGQHIRNMEDDESNNKLINEYREKPGFGELMQMQLVDGRFVRESIADSASIVLNVSAMKMLGLKPHAGQYVLYNNEKTQVIGVVKDFYYKSNPGEPISPLVLSNCFHWTPNVYVRSQNPLTQAQIMQIKSVFTRFDENYVFNHHLLSDVFDRMLKKENRLAKMVLVGASQVVIISLISLLALTILKISRRTKEIGIRKVMGSTIQQVVAGLLKETLVIVSIAIVIASVLSYIVMNQWLADYFERIQLHAGYFLISAVFAFSIAIVATIGQSLYAATRNPVEALKNE